jgi:hypothetical protein
VAFVSLRDNLDLSTPSGRLMFQGYIAVAGMVVVTLLLYGIFKPVNRGLALLAAFFSLVGCAIQAFGSLFQVAPLAVLEGSPYLSVFNVDQLQAVALMSVKLNVPVWGG